MEHNKKADNSLPVWVYRKWINVARIHGRLEEGGKRFRMKGTENLPQAKSVNCWADCTLGDICCHVPSFWTICLPHSKKLIRSMKDRVCPIEKTLPFATIVFLSRACQAKWGNFLPSSCNDLFTCDISGCFQSDAWQQSTSQQTSSDVSAFVWALTNFSTLPHKLHTSKGRRVCAFPKRLSTFYWAIKYTQEDRKQSSDELSRKPK